MLHVSIEPPNKEHPLQRALNLVLHNLQIKNTSVYYTKDNFKCPSVTFIQRSNYSATRAPPLFLQTRLSERRLPRQPLGVYEQGAPRRLAVAWRRKRRRGVKTSRVLLRVSSTCHMSRLWLGALLTYDRHIMKSTKVQTLGKLHMVAENVVTDGQTDR